VVDPNVRDDPGTECQLGVHTINNQDSLPERRAAVRARDVLSDMMDVNGLIRVLFMLKCKLFISSKFRSRL
jgi:hypothetical protein